MLGVQDDTPPSQVQAIGFYVLIRICLVCPTEEMLSVKCSKLELTSSLSNLKPSVRNLEHTDIPVI